MTTKTQAQANVAEFKNSLVNKTNQQLISEVNKIVDEFSKNGKTQTVITSSVLFPQAVVDEIRAAGFEIARKKDDYLFFSYLIRWE